MAKIRHMATKMAGEPGEAEGIVGIEEIEGVEGMEEVKQVGVGLTGRKKLDVQNGRMSTKLCPHLYPY